MLFIIFLLYTAIMFLMFGEINAMIALMTLEVLSWIFVMLIPNITILIYLLVQSIFFLVGIMGLLWLGPVMMISFLLKLGLPPFYMWYMRIASFLKKFSFIFMSTFHKLGPIVFLCKMMNSALILTSIVLMILVSAPMMGSNVLLSTLVFSSMAHTLWMIMSVQVSKGFMLLYWACYASVLGLLLNQLPSGKLKQFNLKETTLMSFCWGVLSGVPPFLFFWLKAYTVSSILNIFSILMMGLLLVMSVIVLSAYYRSWYFSILMNSKNLIKEQMSMLIYFILSWLWFF